MPAPRDAAAFFQQKHFSEDILRVPWKRVGGSRLSGVALLEPLAVCRKSNHSPIIEVAVFTAARLNNK
jgi:hypothetical protein